MSAPIVIGAGPTGTPVTIDMEELLATRLLVQGNSGSGKSHLLRRVLEESAAIVQQVVIDPEGDFVTLAEPFGHIVIDAAAYSSAEIGRLAARRISSSSWGNSRASRKVSRAKPSRKIRSIRLPCFGRGSSPCSNIQ